jgi:hypothetical protein
MITFATFSAFPMNHTSAEENITAESTTRLSALEITEFELDQAFSKDITTYTATVSNDTNSMSLLLDTEIDSSLLTVNGEEVTSKEQLIYSLNTGENIFTITLTNGSEVTIYTLTIFRAFNDSSSLSNLTLSNGNLNFSPSITSYSVDVENSISSVTIKPETSVDTSTVHVEGIAVDPKKGHTIELPVGKTTVSFVITAENGNQSTYTVTITRAAMVNSSSDTNTTDRTKIDTNQTAIIKDQPTITNLVSSAQTGSNRTSSTVQVASTSSTGAQAETPTTANLSAITLSSGTWNKTFDSDTYTYHIAVGPDLTSVTLTATTDKSDAEVAIEGSTSTTVTLPNQAKTPISVTVTNGEDRKTYVLVFDKDMGEAETTETSNTNETTEAAVSNTTNSTVAQSNRSGNQRGQNEQTVETSNQSSETSGSIWDWIKSLFDL